MKKLIIISILSSLLFSACGKKDESSSSLESVDAGTGKLSISMSSIGTNFIDFPLKVKSIVLIKEDGGLHELLSGFSINLANLGDKPHYIFLDSNVPSGTYTRVMVNLSFDENSKVTYFNALESSKPITEYMISQTGKVLGVEHSQFMINMPVYNSELVVSSAKPRHLNFDWNLNASTDIHATDTDDNWLIEFSPLVKAEPFKGDELMNISATLSGFENNTMKLQSVFQSQDKGMTVNLSAINTFFSGNRASTADELKRLSVDSYVELVGSLSISGEKTSVNANKVTYFDNQEVLVKGLVSKVTETTLDVLGLPYSTPAYLTESNKTYRVPSALTTEAGRVYDLFSKIHIRLSAEEAEASQYRGGFPYVLRGPDDVYNVPASATVLTAETVNASDNSDTSDEGSKTSDTDSDNAISSDVFFFMIDSLTKGDDESELDDKGVDDNGDQFVTILSINGFTYRKHVKVLLDPDATGASSFKWEKNKLWRTSDAILSLRGGDNRLLTLSALPEEVLSDENSTLIYDHKYAKEGFSWNLSDPIKPTIDLEIDLSKTIDDLLEGDDKSTELFTKLTFSHKLPLTLQESDNQVYECKSITTNLPNKGETYTEGSTTIIFEKLTNDESWTQSDKDALMFDFINEASLDGSGDVAKAQVFYSAKQIYEALKSDEMKDTPLYIHQVKLISSFIGDDFAVTDKGHCPVDAKYILIRWYPEGTQLDAYRAAHRANVNKNIQTVAVYATLGVAGAVALGALAVLIKKAAVKSIVNKFGAESAELTKALGDANARLGEWDKFYQELKIRSDFDDFDDFDDNDSGVGDDETRRNLSSVSLDDINVDLNSQRLGAMTTVGDPSLDASRTTAPDFSKLPPSGVTGGSNKIPGRK